MLARLTLVAAALVGAAAITTIAHGGASVTGGPGLIVFSSKRSENLFPQVYSITESGRGRRLVPRPARASSYPVPSPDGTRIALTSGEYDGWIYVGRSRGGGWRRIGLGSEVAWSPNSRRLAFTRLVEREPDTNVRAVSVADLATGAVRDLAEGTHPSWSPDGRRIAVARTEAPDLEPFVAVVSATNGRTLRRLTVQGNPTWAPRGDRIAVVAWGTLTVVRENGTTVGRSRLELISDPSWSSDASRLAAIAGGRLLVLRSDARRLRRITRATQREETPAPPSWSPDGTKIAFERKAQIHAIDIRRNRFRQVTHEPPGSVLTSGPVWSRSGRILYAAARPNHPYDLYTMRADGSRVRRLIRTRASELAPAWSPDGRQVAFTRRDALFSLDVVTRRARRIIVRGVPRQSAPTWSPDGSRIAFVGGRLVEGVSQPTGLYVVPAAGGRARRIVRRTYLGDARWSPDGKIIAFVASSSVFVIRPDGRGLRKVAEPDVVYERCWYWISAVAWVSRDRLAFLQSYECQGEQWPHEPTIKIVRLDGTRVASMPTQSTGRVVWSRDGRWIVQSGEYGDDISENIDGDIVRMRADGSARVNITHGRTGIDADWQPICTLLGNHKPNRLRGTGGNDRICGLSADDTITGLGGEDRLFGEEGDDRFFARDGQFDVIGCGAGRDTVVADRGDLVGRDCEHVRRS
jgi:Tol biopolymer transport system component